MCGEASMEFNEKPQELRKCEGLTQEELACALHVSRTAVSKWESGRGPPSIDSLKNISQHFGVSLDELLSSERLLSIAEDEGKRKTERHLTTALRLIDCAALLLTFLPVFSVHAGGGVVGVALPSLLSAKPILFAVSAVATAATVLLGAMALLRGGKAPEFWRAGGRCASQALTCVCILAFIATRQIYAAAIALVDDAAGRGRHFHRSHAGQPQDKRKRHASTREYRPNRVCGVHGRRKNSFRRALALGHRGRRTAGQRACNGVPRHRPRLQEEVTQSRRFRGPARTREKARPSHTFLRTARIIPI